MDRQIEERGYASTIDVLINLGYLSSGDYREWMDGRILFLEKVLRIGPSKVLDLMTVMNSHAKKQGYKGSVKPYMNGKKKLRFSRTGNAVIEDRFATHYVDKYWSED